MCNALVAFFGGFVMVVSGSFRATFVSPIGLAVGAAVVAIVLAAQLEPARSVLQRGVDIGVGLLGGLVIAACMGGSSPDLRWALFAFALGWVGLSSAGLVLRRHR